MGELKYDFTRPEVLWGHTDILETDLEKMEYDKNFGGEEAYNSILDDEPVYHSLMNFPEDEEEALFEESDDDEDGDVGNNPEDEDPFKDREDYRETDQDNVYYLI